MYSGKGEPKKEIGQEGDFYIDMLNKRLYGPKTKEGWADQFIRLEAPSIHNYDYQIAYENLEEDNFKGIVLKEWLTKRTKTINMNDIEELKGVQRIAHDAFKNCNQLETIILGENVEIIEDEVFKDLENLKVVVLNSKLKALRSRTFSNTGLVEIKIPKNIIRFDKEVFAYCKHLKTVIMESETPPLMEEDRGIDPLCFDGAWALESIYVPAGSVTLYKRSRGWKEQEKFIKARP